MGVLFDECAERGHATEVLLDRPFDIAPEAGTAHSVAALAALVQDMAGRLAAAGARPGDRVAIVKDNHWDYDLLACAAVRIGALPAQLSGELPAESLRLLLERLRPSLLVTSSGVLERCRAGGTDLLPAADACVLLDGELPGTLGLESLQGHPVPGPRRRHDDEPLVINHTSGTTGVPKLVVHSTRTIIRKLARFETVRYPRIGVRRDDTLLNANSFAHGRTFCWTASALCLAPRRICVVTGQDPDAADPLLRACPPTIVEALPASFVRFRPLTARLDNPFRQVRLFISTYDAVHPPTIRAYLGASAHRGALWMQGWGQTETGPLTFRFHTRRSVADGGDGADARNLGRPVPFKTRLRVVDPETLAPLPRGRAGLVLARTAARGLAYVGEDGRWTAKQHGGWWNTGDVGILRRDGSVRLLDREVDRTPELSCLATEDAVEDRLPQVLECVLLAAPGEPPLPVVVTADGTLDRARWQEAVRDLPTLRPPTVLTWDEVPRTGTGKVRRGALRRRLTGRTDTCGSGRWT
ncbi:long-chain acyl-CoA synthetase [Streptomyces sp. Ru73]|uniref:class I adenylate-forming enzyme family protein n=1 Tax=Streptomyces sp. Ru73 TaxID=2080748 RepID=UPI000CDD9B16|nr:class I adenylate-forming enzyme family protein [Streptomyces sp. Ru73]POX38917.1 long-chain acyl-CoA synthetase [Streptomyces sp. Ru73]